MRGQRVWVLLLLAAVFTMHGLECAGADNGVPSTVHDLGVHALAGDPVLDLAASSTVMASDGMSMGTLSGAVAHAGVGVPLGAGRGPSPHQSGHLWAWCLAVLAAGLAALLLGVVGRHRALRLLIPRRVTGFPWSWLGPLRPPDLYSLCLMRI